MGFFEGMSCRAVQREGRKLLAQIAQDVDYNPGERIAAMLVRALQSKGFIASLIPVVRPGSQPITALPEAPVDGFLDVRVETTGYTGSNPMTPRAWATARLVSPTGVVLLEQVFTVEPPFRGSSRGGTVVSLAPPPGYAIDVRTAATNATAATARVLAGIDAALEMLAGAIADAVT